MPLGVTEGLSLASGLMGMFGGKQRGGAGYRRALREQGLQSAMADRIAAYVDAYDPIAESQAAVDYAEKSAGRTMGIGMADINRRFLAAGGNPSGDTAFTALKRRKTDDVLNPLMEFTANARANAKQMKLNALMQSYGARGDAYASASNLASQEMGMGGRDMSGSLGMIAQGLQGAFGGIGKKSPRIAASSGYARGLRGF